MARLTWGQKNPYQYGAHRGVFYPKNGVGHAWSGLISVVETTVDARKTRVYVDGVGRDSLFLTESFSATVDAVTFPAAFNAYDGYFETKTGQRRSPFDFCFTTRKEDNHYKIHLVYNALMAPTTKNHSSINTNIDVELFSWNLTTINEPVPGAKSTSYFMVDSSMVNPGLLVALENRLYGADGTNADMPTVKELLQLFEDYAIFKVIDNGDGTATISGPDTAVRMLDVSTASLSWPSVIFEGEDTYQLTSL